MRGVKCVVEGFGGHPLEDEKEARAGLQNLRKKRSAPWISGPVFKEGDNNTGKFVRVLVHQPVSATPDPDNP